MLYTPRIPGYLYLEYKRTRLALTGECTKPCGQQRSVAIIVPTCQTQGGITEARNGKHLFSGDADMVNWYLGGGTQRSAMKYYTAHILQHMLIVVLRRVHFNVQNIVHIHIA